MFFMDGPEGRLFKPLAFTKTFALVGAAISAITAYLFSVEDYAEAFADKKRLIPRLF